MSDIFREVDEEVRREQLKKLWDRYGILILGAAVLLVVAVGGWRGYEWWEAKKAAEAGAAFEAAAQLSAEGKHDDAATAFAKVAAEGTASYRSLAKLREAAELAQRDPKAAAAAYDALAADAKVDQVQRDFATVRAGYVRLDTDAYDDMRKRLEPATAADRAFRHSARALLAFSAWRNNDLPATRRWSEMILTDPETPVSTRGQIEMLMSLAGSADGKT